MDTRFATDRLARTKLAGLGDLVDRTERSVDRRADVVCEQRSAAVCDGPSQRAMHI